MKMTPTFIPEYDHALDMIQDRDREAFWMDAASRIDWHTPPRRALEAADPVRPDWFPDGQLNLCHNAVDRHLRNRATQTALVHIDLTEPSCNDAGAGKPTAPPPVQTQTRTPRTRRFTYRELYDEVNAMAIVLQNLGVFEDARVMLYLPTIPETVFAMLACARLGAVHAVVFAGFPAASLAVRIDACRPQVIVTTRAYEMALLDALDMATQDSEFRQPVPHRLIVDVNVDVEVDAQDEGTIRMRTNTGTGTGTGTTSRQPGTPGADADPSPAHDYRTLRAAVIGRHIPCVTRDSAAPSYILYTSGTTGAPKGIVRDTGGHAVALLASLRHQFETTQDDVFFTTSDLGWVVGHSYGVYAPLLAGMTSVLYRPDPGKTRLDAVWNIVAAEHVSVFLSAPSVMRLRRRHMRPDEPPGHAAYFKGPQPGRPDLSRLKAVYLAGEPMDHVVADNLRKSLGVPVIDHYWQTETGSPILADGRPVQGFDVTVADETTRQATSKGTRGILTLRAPLPPGCAQMLWQNDHHMPDIAFAGADADADADADAGVSKASTPPQENERAHLAYRRAYWSITDDLGILHQQASYSTSDWAMLRPDGSIRLLGRSDDTINVAGQRIGTREIEDVIRADPAVVDVAVVGIVDQIRGQVPLACVVLDVDTAQRLSDESAESAMLAERLTARLAGRVASRLGKAARPRRICFVDSFPRTRSGKIIRREIQAMFAGVPARSDQSTMDMHLSLPVSCLSTLREKI